MRKDYLNSTNTKKERSLRGNIYIIFLSAILFITQAAISQTIPATDGGVVCFDCAPPGWVKGAGTPDVSDATSASTVGTWDLAPIPLPPNGHASWLSLRDLGLPSPDEEDVSTTMTGLIPGATYEVTIYSMSTLSAAYSPAYIDVFTYQVGTNPIQTVSPVSQDVWGINTFQFQASGTTDQLFLRPGFNVVGGSSFYESVQLSVTLNAISLVPDPDIEITGNGTIIVDGQTATNETDATDFGETILGAPIVQQFTINNIGTLDLNLTLPIILNDLGSGIADFTIVNPPALIIAGGSATFDVIFTPTTAGDQTIEISVSSDDPNEDPYTFNITATGLLDTDGDTVGDIYDLDDDNDGISDATEGVGDTDGDGIVDSLDLDSDNDGIRDVIETGGTDADGDGILDGFVDVDVNGFDDSIENPENYSQDNAASTFTEVNATTGWVDEGTALGTILTSDATDSRNGGFSLKYETTLAGGGRNISYSFPITIGTVYDIKIWAKRGTSPTGMFATWEGFAGFVQTNFTADEWTLYEWTLTANAAIGNIEIYAHTTSGIAAGTIFIDEISIRESLVQTLPNNDTDTFVDYLDLDSDGDGIPDNIEAQPTVAYVTPNAVYDASGVDTAYPVGLVPVNTDFGTTADTLPDFLDTDSDEEGGDDTAEAGLTLSGVVGTNGLDSSSETADDYTDVNGIFDNPSIDFPDTDGDVALVGGDVDYRDAIFSLDTDLDGVLDITDLDSDNDGILDLDEYVGGLDPYADADGDGVSAYLDDDESDPLIGDTDGLVQPAFDLDNDGVANHLDLDVDGDGLPDNIEAQPTVGYIAPNGVVDPITGIDTAYGAGIATLVNSDFAITADVLPDFLDTNSDEEGGDDTAEAGLTLSGVVGVNGLIASSETVDDYTDVNGIFDNPSIDFPDTDGDLLLGGDVDYRDSFADPDTDGDTIIDSADLDDDGDGIPDNVEDPCNNTYNFNLTSEQWYTINNNDNSQVFSNPASHSTDGVTTNVGCTINIIGNANQNIAGSSPSVTNYIVDADPAGGVTYLRSPSFGGADFSEFFGGTLRYDNYTYRVGFTGDPGWFTGPAADGEVLIYGTNGDVIVASHSMDFTNFENGIWNSHNLAFDTATWSGTAAQIQGVLASVDYVSIKVEFITGGNSGNCADVEYFAIDNLLFDAPTVGTCNNDNDGDGVVNSLDLDSDNDGILDSVEGSLDTDGDGIPNYLDLDSDNDGIYDVVEAGLANFDTDNDGIVNLGSVGTNGLFDGLETFPDSGILNPIYTPLDSSTVAGVPTPNGIFDFLELDSDTDGCMDVVEAGYTDGDADGLLGSSPVVTDGNGIVISGIDGYTTPNDLNINLIFDFQEYAATTAITTSPTDQTILTGSVATFTVVVSSGDTFVWEESVAGIGGPYVPVTDGGVYSGQNTATLTLTGVPLSFNGNYYRVVVSTSNLACDIPEISGVALLTVGNDSDGDLIDDSIDLDDDNDGIPDVDENAGGVAADFDGDGIPNSLDLDSDNDGIYDVVESGQLNGTTVIDLDNNGILDGVPADFGANGLLDAIETDDTLAATVTIATADSDGDTIADSNELNADGDGCNDVLEAGFTDLDLSGRLGADAGLTVDGNGVVNTPGLTDGYTTPLDGDGNGIFDFQEVGEAVALTTQPVGQTIIINANANFDVTGTSPVYQWQESTDGGTIWTDIIDGGANPLYSGANTASLMLTTVPLSYNGYQYRVILSSPAYACDGNITSDEVVLSMFPDNDADGIPDITDLDDDNDGIPDVDENAGGVAADFDGDGIPNSLDLDSDNDGIYDVVESGQLNGTTVIDLDNNGILDGAPADFGANGLLDAIETDDTPAATVTIATADSDGDTIADSNELNSDGDGCTDVLEAGYTDADGSGRLGSDTGLTVDANGVVNTPGLTDGYTTPLDGDSNGIFDFQEVGMAVDLNLQQPADQMITINANANFDVTGSLAPVYQWQESTDSGATWNDITVAGANPTYSGFNTDALTLTLVPGSYNGYQYRVILSSPAYACDGNITSNAATLTVQADFDGDGVGDPVDLDDDNDGIPDLIELNGLDPLADDDGDGVPNYLDDQPNNIAVGDANGIVEPAYDFDGDNIPNHLDIDSDNDGINDVIEAGHGFPDTDGDGFIDGADTGSGANGLFDGVETDPDVDPTLNYPITDTDNDGNSNFLDTDDDNDGIDTIVETPNGDTDGDGVDNHLDIDDDNDGILTATEGTTNGDGDSRPNYLDQDSDGDGIADNVEGQTTAGYISPAGTDSDNDGLDDAYDLFDNNTVTDPNNNVAGENGIQAADVDTDSGIFGADGNPDYLDLDSDGDNVPDSIEGHDLDENGVADNFPSGDSDNDGLDDSFDGDISGFGDPNGSIITTNPATDLPDTDGTEDVNYRDFDDDGDGIHTRFEDIDPTDGDFANDNTDGDEFPNYLDNDDDGDGILTADENPDPNGDGNPADAQDIDNDGIPDYLDDDDDNDGIPTADEGTGDTDGDGRPDYLDIDDDGDGIMTINETVADEDGDSHPNYLDLDSDDDGIPDNVEGQTTADYETPTGIDSDNDGLDDAYDNFDNNANNVLANYEGGNGIQPVNTDGTDNEDYLDDDSDNDNVPDFVEGHDFDADGNPDIEASGNDTDGDGLDDAYDSSSDFSDPNGLTISTGPATDLPNRDQSLFDMFSPTTAITPDAEVDYRDTDDDGDGRLTNSTGEDGEDTDSDGNPRNDNCNGPPDNNSPNYLDPVPCNFIPSGFSPNGDNQNEEFIINQLSQYPNFTMEVYDRWGNIVYEYSNNGRAEPLWWDGFSTGSRTLNKGQKVPVGTYYYVIEYNQDGRSPIAGWVYINY